MKQTKNLKQKLYESQLDVGSLIDPKINLKQKPVNEVEHWALGSMYWTVHYIANKCISNEVSVLLWNQIYFLTAQPPKVRLNVYNITDAHSAIYKVYIDC